MSLITRCPACGTMFKVVPDQLRISEGWVRCGHCADVFDATAHLQGSEPAQAPGGQGEPPAHAEAPTPSPAAIAAEPPASPPWAPPPSAASPVMASAAAALVPEDQHAGGQAVPPWPGAVKAAPSEPPRMASPADVAPDSENSEWADARFAASQSSYFTDDDPPPWQPVREDKAGVDRPAADDAWPLAEGGGRQAGDAPLPRLGASAGPAWARAAEAGDSLAGSAGPRATEDEPPETDLQDLSFVRQAQRKAFWARPLVRGLLVGVCLALLAALGLQYALQERDRLAALQPELRPALEALCEPLGCKVGPPRQIESIVIDSSSFSKLRPDAYRLSLTLKNQAPMPVAMPAIELTLTDGQDQPVLRRVLLPADLGARAPAIAASADWSGAFTLNVANGNAPRIAGYRVLAFYP